MKIPEPIEKYANHIIDYGYFTRNYSKEELEEKRLEAIESVRIYKTYKNLYAQQCRQTKHIKDWLEHIKNI
jgi:hypothetical protein